MGGRPRTAEWPPAIQRLLDAYGADGLAELGRRMGTPASNVKNWAQRGSVPLDAMIQASKDTRRSLDWLVLGEEHQGVSAESDFSDLVHGGNAKNLKNRVREHLGQMVEGGDFERVAVDVDWDRFVLVPRYDARASAGPGLPAAEDAVQGAIAFEADFMREQLGRVGTGFAQITVRGTSMEPTLFDGMSIVVDTTRRDVEDGGIFVLRRDGELLVKRLQLLMSGALQIISDNPAMRPELVPAGAELQLDVIGKVVWPRSR